MLSSLHTLTKILYEFRFSIAQINIPLKWTKTVTSKVGEPVTCNSRGLFEGNLPAFA
jgi:hypothetical protein